MVEPRERLWHGERDRSVLKHDQATIVTAALTTISTLLQMGDENLSQAADSDDSDFLQALSTLIPMVCDLEIQGF